MKKHNLKINVLLQIMYQVIILVIPLITAPYLTRHLGDNGLGNYTFSYTIAYYFVLLGMLGINKYDILQSLLVKFLFFHYFYMKY